MYNVTDSNIPFAEFNETVISDDNETDYMISIGTSNGTKYQFCRITTVQNELHQFEFSSFIVTIPMILLVLYLSIRSAFPKDAFKFLALQHLVVGYVHVLCVTFYSSPDDSDDIMGSIYSLMLETASLTDLVSVFTTSCIAWIIFLRLFLFRDGEELYDIKGITFFAVLFIGIIQGYEAFMNMFNCDDFLRSTLRLTSVLLIMCVSFSALCVIVVCLSTNLMALSKSLSLFSIGHLLILMSSDIILLRFNFVTQSELLWLWDLLLYSRLVVEMIGYFIHDYYFKKYVF